MAFFGIAEAHLLSIDDDPAARRVYAGPYFEVNIEGSATEAQAQGYVAGKLQTTSSAIVAEETTMTLTAQETDWSLLELVFGEIGRNSTTETLSRTVLAVVPKTAPYEVALTGMTAAAEIHAVTMGTDAMQLEVVATAPAAASEIQPGTDKLTFHEDLAGKSVTVQYYTTIASVRVLGGASADPQYLSRFEMATKLIGPRFPNGAHLWIPDMSLTSLPSFATGEVMSFEMTFRLATPPGWIKPYQITEL